MICPVCRVVELEDDQAECELCADVDLDGLPYDDDHYYDPYGAIEDDCWVVPYDA